VSPPAGIPFVDLSSNQPPSKTDWAAIAASGHGHAFLRATEGVVPDSAFVAHRKAARAAGVLVGAYIFWRPRHSAYENVQALLDAAGTLAGTDWDLPLVIDLEAEDKPDQLEKEDLEHHVSLGLTEIRVRTGVSPLLYTGPGFVGAHLPADHRLGQWALWNADYRDTPALPRGWTEAVARQYTGTGRVPGYPGNADVSVWLCSPEELRSLCYPKP